MVRLAQWVSTGRITSSSVADLAACSIFQSGVAPRTALIIAQDLRMTISICILTYNRVWFCSRRISQLTRPRAFRLMVTTRHKRTPTCPFYLRVVIASGRPCGGGNL
jgi:hypothetical protein